MNRVNFARCSGVIIDFCRLHGTWFDHQELHRIVQFVQRGGLTKSRALELETLEEERRRAGNRAALSPPACTSYHPGMFGLDAVELTVYAACRVAGWILRGLF